VLADSAATDESTATVEDNTLEFTFASDAELVEATPVNPETEAIASGADSFEVPSFLDTAPNIEFSSESEGSTPIAFNEEFSIADNSVIDFSTSDSEPVAFEIPDTPMEISFDVPSDKIEGTSFDGSLPLIDHPEIDNANLQSSNESVNFDFSLDEADTAPIDTKDSVSDVASNEFDFSAISLDLGDDDTQSLLEDADDSGIDSPIASEAVSSENQDVDIKLDLVAAYIDMDDKEGARELLEEVLKEGGPQQKLKAEQLLAGL